MDGPRVDTARLTLVAGTPALVGAETEGRARLAALLGWAYAQPGVTRVVAETLPGLPASIRVLEKAGFHPSPPGSEPGVLRFAHDRRR